MAMSVLEAQLPAKPSLPIRPGAVDAVTIVDRETRMSLLSALKESQSEGRSIGGGEAGAN
jgi:hypothetical protein